jgi:hypothetical protein
MFAAVCLGCAEDSSQPSAAGIPDDFSYGGEQKPGSKPLVFARGIISSTDASEMGCSMAPNGTEFYFVREHADENVDAPVIWVSREVDGEWAVPEMVSFTGENSDFSPFVTYDNEYMLFYRMAPSGVVSDVERGTWISERTAEGWAEPEFLVDRYCVTTADFRLFYFGFEEGDVEGRDIGCMTLENSEFSTGVVLEGDANSPEWDAHPYISPDHTYLMFDSDRPGGFGGADMYISFLQEDSTWSEAENLGEEINAVNGHMPSISPDGKYLFFSAEGDIWWVSLEGIEKTR